MRRLLPSGESPASPLSSASPAAGAAAAASAAAAAARRTDAASAPDTPPSIDWSTDGRLTMCVAAASAASTQPHARRSRVLSATARTLVRKQSFVFCLRCFSSSLLVGRCYRRRRRRRRRRTRHECERGTPAPPCRWRAASAKTPCRTATSSPPPPPPPPDDDNDDGCCLLLLSVFCCRQRRRGCEGRASGRCWCGTHTHTHTHAARVRKQHTCLLYTSPSPRD